MPVHRSMVSRVRHLLSGEPGRGHPAPTSFFLGGAGQGGYPDLSSRSFLFRTIRTIGRPLSITPITPVSIAAPTIYIPGPSL